MATIYRKTAKGHSEIETRSHRLSPRLRSALILVDGRRSDDELRKLIPQQSDDSLQFLNEQGFIEIIGITQSAVPAARPVPAAAAPSAPPASRPQPLEQPSIPPSDFAATRALAVRLFTDMVGPMAEALALKMERTRSPDELRPLVQTAQRIIGNTRGGQAAADYGTRLLM
ncbi:MAG: hypothetical protein J0M00_19865 [Burkholderiales bacterium]|nr:hypothetical protein [Burkholderiales bacterium]